MTQKSLKIKYLKGEGKKITVKNEELLIKM